MKTLLRHWRILVALLLVSIGSSAATAEDEVLVTVNRLDEGFAVETAMTVAVSPQTAWAVLTDYDRMAEALPNLSSNKVVRREGNLLVVKQEGSVRYGLLTVSFQSEREIRLEPPTLIHARQVSGSARRMTSETHIENLGDQSPDQPPKVRIVYRAELVPESIFARLFGGPFVRDSIEEQFRLLLAQMKRREAATR